MLLNKKFERLSRDLFGHYRGISMVSNTAFGFGSDAYRCVRIARLRVLILPLRREGSSVLFLKLKINKMKKYIKKIFNFFRYCPIVSVQYDSQDNLVKIGNGRWQQSWDLDTNQPANSTIAVRYDWDNKRLKIVTNMATGVRQVKVQGKVCSFTRSGNMLLVFYDDMHWWMNNSDIFYIDMKRY